ncbi:hypothetical protein [Vibrio sinaloensis]|uniref:hypothetical protein n=1 Tax=Photobacterium sp. (strain ATCC 43367) TaxID=379097 RepID=UPI0035EC02C6
MNKNLLTEQIRAIIGEGSSVNKVERLTEYVLSLGQGSGGGNSESERIFKPMTFALEPIKYPDEILEKKDDDGGDYYMRKDVRSLRNRKGNTPIHYRELIPSYISDPIFADPAGHQNKEIELIVNVNIRYEIALNSEGFENIDKWGGLTMEIGFDVDSEPEISFAALHVPLTVTRDRDNVLILTANYTKAIYLPLGFRELTDESLNFTFNNPRLACALDWSRAGFTFPEYSEKLMWKKDAIELNRPPITNREADPFCLTIMNMNVVDKVVEDVVPM